MEGTGYVDLFATKGIEYLLVIGFLMALVLFWRLLNRTGSSAERPLPTVASLERWFRIPESFLFHQGHGWVLRDQPDVVTVGVDDFAQKLVGRAGAVDLPAVGASVEQGEAGWTLRFDSKSIDLLSPVSGEIVAVNRDVLRSPELINEDPYGKGWLMKVRVSKIRRDLTNLLSGSTAATWMDETVDALRRRMTGSLGMALQDGGEPVEGIARNLSQDRWEEIAREFLLTR